MIKRSLDLVRRFHDGLRKTEHVYMVLVSVLIGLLGGLGAVGFRKFIEIVNQVAWREAEYTLEYIYELPIWWKILAPSTGGAIVGLIIWRFAREVSGHGVPEVMEAVALRGGRIRPRVVFAKLVASGICIGTGGSVGREGPIVQIGSALGSTIGQWLRIDRERLRTLVGCGAAAGIAATFNAPVAGALFAVEIILGDFGVAQFSPIVISSVVGTVVSQHYLGDFPAFVVPPYSLEHPNELFAYAGLGILAGLVALGFIRTLYASEDLFAKFRVVPPIRAAVGGAAIGVIGIWLPHIFGVGYEAINEALRGTLVWQVMLLLVVVKVIAVSITIGSGGSGGIFAPSLFIGAMLGGAVGTVVHAIWPDSTADPGAYALVGMGAVVAAGTHAPITAIVMIFELTGEYKIILPLMITCIIATLLATRLQAASIYTLKLLRRGVDIHGGRAINVLQDVPATEAMRTEMTTVAPFDSLSQLISVFMDHPGETLFVIDSEGRLVGTVTASELRPAMGDASALSSLVIAEDLMAKREVPAVGPEESLAEVMRMLGTYQGEIPVLKDDVLVGVVWPQDVIERYNTELFKRDMARGLVSAVSRESKVGLAPTVEDAVVAEVPAPGSFVGRSIQDLNIRQDFGCSILMIKRRTKKGGEKLDAAPAPDYIFQDGDVMLVLGPGRNIGALERGIPAPS
ncbi:MAG: chloride channel protein [Planctomycetota bacterium]|jgi:CIC family chloride channel protein